VVLRLTSGAAPHGWAPTRTACRASSALRSCTRRHTPASSASSGPTAPRSLPQCRTCTGNRTPHQPGHGVAAEGEPSPVSTTAATRLRRMSPAPASASTRSGPSTMFSSMALARCRECHARYQVPPRPEADVGCGTARDRSNGSASSMTTSRSPSRRATAWSGALCARCKSSACTRIFSRTSTNRVEGSRRASRPATTSGSRRTRTTARPERRPATQWPPRRRDSHRIRQETGAARVKLAAVPEEDARGWL